MLHIIACFFSQVSSSDPPTVRRQNVAYTRDKQKQETSSSGIKYTGNIVRPPILPPLDESETTAEVHMHCTLLLYHVAVHFTEEEISSNVSSTSVRSRLSDITENCR